MQCWTSVSARPELPIKQIMALSQARDSLRSFIETSQIRYERKSDAIQKIKKLPEFQSWLNSVVEHIKLIGVKFRLEDDILIIEPVQKATTINQFAYSLARHGQQLQFDFASHIYKTSVATYSNLQKVIFISFDSLVKGEPDRSLVHEAGHYFMYRADQFNFYRPLMGRFKPLLGKVFDAYPNGFSSQEILTHARDVRILLGQIRRGEDLEKNWETLNKKIKKLQVFAKIVSSFKITKDTDSSARFEFSESSDFGSNARIKIKGKNLYYEIKRPLTHELDKDSVLKEAKSDYEYLLQIAKIVSKATHELPADPREWKESDLAGLNDLRNEIYGILIERYRNLK